MLCCRVLQLQRGESMAYSVQCMTQCCSLMELSTGPVAQVSIGNASLCVLQSGAVLGRRFQPYESHIPFLLQIKVTCV